MIARNDSGYERTFAWDEVGNLLEATPPGTTKEKTEYDSRGLPVRVAKQDGSEVRLVWDALGNLVTYIDETGESTAFDHDRLGRLTLVRYPDGTSEETTYENTTGRVTATRDRAGVWLSYTFDSSGRLRAVYEGDNPETGTPLREYSYNAAGNLKKVASVEASVELLDQDVLGRPALTRVTRYRHPKIPFGINVTY